MTECGPIQGVTFHEYSLKYFHFPISLLSSYNDNDSPRVFPVFAQAAPRTRSPLSAHIIVDCLKGELSVYYTNYTPATTH